MPLLRYPGSKTKLVDAIMGRFPDEVAVQLFVNPNVHYVEPFLGSGAIGFTMMKIMHRNATVTLADADVGIACLWQAVQKDARRLQDKVWHFIPSVESFYELKARDGEFTDTVDTGFRKLALHRMSVSGFGVMAGGPIGGRNQAGDYTVDCRWRPTRIIATIKKLHRLMSRFANLDIHHADVLDVLKTSAELNLTMVAYLDPPYFEKGDQLYSCKFSAEQHSRLANELNGANYFWVLSYDDHPRIRALYAGHNFQPLEVKYSNAVTNLPQRRKKKEFLIMPHRHQVAIPI